MTDMLVVYITCASATEAKKISKQLLKKHLCVCTNIIPTVHASYLWPPKTDKIESEDETVLLAKTLESKFSLIESEVKSVQTSTDTICVFSLPVTAVSQKYYNWLRGEIK